MAGCRGHPSSQAHSSKASKSGERIATTTASTRLARSMTMSSTASAESLRTRRRASWSMAFRAISSSPGTQTGPSLLVQFLRSCWSSRSTRTRRTRLGSVADLARLADSTDLPTAAAAWRQLNVMVTDDSRQVATAASAAVDGFALHVSTPSVDLGELNLGARSPSIEVKIEGPPLAAASRVESSLPNACVSGVRSNNSRRSGRVEGRSGRGPLKIDGPASSSKPCHRPRRWRRCRSTEPARSCCRPATPPDARTTAEALVSHQHSLTQHARLRDRQRPASRTDSTTSEGTPPSRRTRDNRFDRRCADPSGPTAQGVGAPRRARAPKLAILKKRRSVPVLAAFAMEAGPSSASGPASSCWRGWSQIRRADWQRIRTGPSSLAPSTPGWRWSGTDGRPRPVENRTGRVAPSRLTSGSRRRSASPARAAKAGDPAWGPDEQSVYVADNEGLRIVTADRAVTGG